MSIADVLLVTVTSVESKAVLNVFEQTIGHKAPQESIGDRAYFNLGTVNGARVFMTMQPGMGSGGVGGSLPSVTKGIEALSPQAVIMVGIAFGVNEDKQKIGDVLVSKQLQLYDLQRVGTQENEKSLHITLRGDKPPASSWLVNHFETAALSWNDAKVRFGVVLTGDKLVDNLDYRNRLISLQQEAVGGEMEGAGLYVACHDKKVDWILIKAICDWGDGMKGVDKAPRQEIAARNAAEFVLHGLLQFTAIDWEKRRGQQPSPTPNTQSSSSDLRRSMNDRRRESLQEEIEVIQRQLESTLSDEQKLKLERRLKQKLAEYEELEQLG